MNNDEIKIVIYSYKGKLLKDIVQNTIDKSSKKNKLFFHIYDQYPLQRADFFNSLDRCHYEHIFWDHITSPCLHKKNGIDEYDFKFTMILGDNVFLNENWDEDLINLVKTNSNIIVSGKNITKLRHKNYFYLEKTGYVSENFTLNNYIDRNLIFGYSDTIKKVEYPSYLKYNGEEETLSLMYYCSGVDIYSAPNSLYKKEGDENIAKLYTTFSKDHNYNEFISLLKNGINKYVDISQSKQKIDSFCEYHKISVDEINKIPFPDTDVEYNPNNMEFDSIDSKRFMSKVNYIS